MYLQKSAQLFSSKAPKLETRSYGDVVVFEAVLSKAEVDSDNDIIELDAWKGASEDDVSLCYSHKLDQVAGKWDKIELRDDHLWGKGAVDMSYELGRMCGQSLLSGALKAVSVGFSVPDRKINIVEKDMEIGGKNRRVRTIKKANLHEVSIVARPALRSARVAKSASLFAALKDAGYEQPEIEAVIDAFDAKKSAFRLKTDDGDLFSIRKYESVLMAAGFSKREAQVVIAKGFSTLVTEFDPERDAGGDVDDAAALKTKAERDAGMDEAAIMKALESFQAALKSK